MEDYKTKIEDLENQLEEKVYTLSAYEEELQETTEMLNHSNEECEKKRQENVRLELALSKCKEQLDDAEHLYSIQKNEYLKLSQCMHQIQMGILKGDSSVLDTTMMAERCVRVFKDVENERDNLQQEVNKMQAQIDELKVEVMATNSVEVKNKSEITTLWDKIHLTQQLLSEKEAEILNIKKEYKITRDELSEQQSLVTALTTAASENESEIDSLKNEIESLKSELNEKTSTVSVLTTAASENESEIDSLKNEIESLKSELNEKTSTVSALTTAASENESEIDSLKNEIESLNVANYQFSCDLSLISSSFDSIYSVIENFIVKYSDAYSIIDANRSTIFELTEICESRLRRINELESELSDIRSLNVVPDDRDSLISAYSSMVSALSNRLRHYESELLSLRLQNSVVLNQKLTLQVDQLNQTLDSKQKEMELLQIELMGKSDLIEKLKDELHSKSLLEDRLSEESRSKSNLEVQLVTETQLRVNLEQKLKKESELKSSCEERLKSELESKSYLEKCLKGKSESVSDLEEQLKTIKESNRTLEHRLRDKEQNSESVSSVLKDLTHFVHGEGTDAECKRCKKLKKGICDVCKLKQEIESMKPKERNLKNISEWTTEEKKLVFYSTSTALLLSALVQYIFK